MLEDFSFRVCEGFEVEAQVGVQALGVEVDDVFACDSGEQPNTVTTGVSFKLAWEKVRRPVFWLSQREACF